MTNKGVMQRSQKDILSRESVDEIIYRSKKVRDRLILELQAYFWFQGFFTYTMVSQ